MISKCKQRSQKVNNKHLSLDTYWRCYFYGCWTHTETTTNKTSFYKFCQGNSRLANYARFSEQPTWVQHQPVLLHLAKWTSNRRWYGVTIGPQLLNDLHKSSWLLIKRLLFILQLKKTGDLTITKRLWQF